MAKRDSRKMMKKDKLKLRQLLNKSACVNNKKLKKLVKKRKKMPKKNANKKRTSAFNRKSKRENNVPRKSASRQKQLSLKSKYSFSADK